jgi:hypothetical protein
MFHVRALCVTLRGFIALFMLLFYINFVLLEHPVDGHRGDRNMSVNNM